MTFKSNDELKALIKNGAIEFQDSITCEFSINIEAVIKTAWDITAGNITAWDITAGNITAGNITAGNITAGNITAWDITAWDITAGNITAGNISFYAVCFAYMSLKCKSIIGRRVNHKFGCLDKEIEYVKDEAIPSLVGQEVEVKMNGKTYKAKITAEQ